MEAQLHHQQQFFINFVAKGRFGFKITSFNVNSINAHAYLPSIPVASIKIQTMIKFCNIFQNPNDPNILIGSNYQSYVLK